ncbi:MAG: hypothetical protein ACP5HZ_09730 [Ferrimicrobium sp.]
MTTTYSAVGHLHGARITRNEAEEDTTTPEAFFTILLYRFATILLYRFAHIPFGRAIDHQRVDACLAGLHSMGLW